MMWCNVGFAECIEGDCSNGYGTYTWENGSKYVGEWKDGEFYEGTRTWANGAKYAGEFKDFKFHGQGTYTNANGNKYVGEFKDGKYNGLGTLTCGSKKYTLKGGKIDCKPGRKIEAIWEDGSPIDILIIK